MGDLGAVPHHHVVRSEILDYQTYEDAREAERARIFEVKRPRRIHLGDHLTFLFENHDTIRYQIQEMVRTERIVRESSIREEIDTYNQTLGGSGHLGCVLLIEIEEEARRKPLLEEWMGLQEHIFVELADGTGVYAKYDPAQVGDRRLSAVQYLTFNVADGPVALGCDLPALEGTVALDEGQRSALGEDLAATTRTDSRRVRSEARGAW